MPNYPEFGMGAKFEDREMEKTMVEVQLMAGR